MIIGIDPGVNTGVAMLDNGKLTACFSTSILQAIALVRDWHKGGALKYVVYEDARLYNGRRKAPGAAQGAGSIKRDCQIWQEALDDIGCPYRGIRPQEGATKWKADKFKVMTGWVGPSNNHGRDAACLIWGMK